MDAIVHGQVWIGRTPGPCYEVQWWRALSALQRLKDEGPVDPMPNRLLDDAPVNKLECFTICSGVEIGTAWGSHSNVLSVVRNLLVHLGTPVRDQS